MFAEALEGKGNRSICVEKESDAVYMGCYGSHKVEGWNYWPACRL
jgi:hypothetical protein